MESVPSIEKDKEEYSQVTFKTKWENSEKECEMLEQMTQNKRNRKDKWNGKWCKWGVEKGVGTGAPVILLAKCGILASPFVCSVNRPRSYKNPIKLFA